MQSNSKSRPSQKNERMVVASTSKQRKKKQAQKQNLFWPMLSAPQNIGAHK